MFKHDPYESGVLKEDVHSGLVAKIDTYARDARIPPHWVWTPLADTASPSVVHWVKNFPKFTQEGKVGLCMVGPPELHEDYSCAIAGCFLRNFIRAQVITLQQLIEEIQEGDPPDPTCLVIPNLYLGGKGALADWRAAQLLDYLIQRKISERATVVCIAKTQGMSHALGEELCDFVLRAYHVVSIGE